MAEGELTWASARETLTFFWRLNGGALPKKGERPLETAIAEIIYRSKDAVRTRAKSVTIGDFAAPSLISKEGLLPPVFWEPGAVNMWQSASNWGLGTVAGSHDNCCAIAYGVQFCVQDLEEFTGETMKLGRPAAGRAAVVPEVAIKGPPKKTRMPAHWWAEFSLHLAIEVHDNGIPAGTGSVGQGTVIAAVLKRMKNHEDVDRSSVQPVVQALIDHIRSSSAK